MWRGSEVSPRVRVAAIVEEADVDVSVKNVEVLRRDIRHIVDVLLRVVDPEETLGRRGCNERNTT